MLCFVKCIRPSRRLADIARTVMLLMLSAITLKDTLLRMTWPFSTECTVNLIETTSGNKGCTVRMGYNRTFLPQGSCNLLPYFSLLKRNGDNRPKSDPILTTPCNLGTKYEGC